MRAFSFFAILTLAVLSTASSSASSSEEDEFSAIIYIDEYSRQGICRENYSPKDDGSCVSFKQLEVEKYEQSRLPTNRAGGGATLSGGSIGGSSESFLNPGIQMEHFGPNAGMPMFARVRIEPGVGHSQKLNFEAESGVYFNPFRASPYSAIGGDMDSFGGELYLRAGFSVPSDDDFARATVALQVASSLTSGATASVGYGDQVLFDRVVLENSNLGYGVAVELRKQFHPLPIVLMVEVEGLLGKHVKMGEFTGEGRYYFGRSPDAIETRAAPYVALQTGLKYSSLTTDLGTFPSFRGSAGVNAGVAW